MTDLFKVRDNKLLDNVFMLADVDGQGALDIRELCAVLVIHMRGEIEFKLALFFEIMKSRTVVELADGGFILKANLIKVIEDAQQFLKQAFSTAKKTADEMNTALNGQISAAEFKSFCERSPSSMDFLCRLTIGNTGFLQYPQPLNENYQNQQLQTQNTASQFQQQEDQIAENRN